MKTYDYQGSAPLLDYSEQSVRISSIGSIIDRLIHHAKILSINGKSYQMKDYMETKVPAIEK